MYKLKNKMDDKKLLQLNKELTAIFEEIEHLFRINENYDPIGVCAEEMFRYVMENNVPHTDLFNGIRIIMFKEVI